MSLRPTIYADPKDAFGPSGYQVQFFPGSGSWSGWWQYISYPPVYGSGPISDLFTYQQTGTEMSGSEGFESSALYSNWDWNADPAAEVDPNTQSLYGSFTLGMPWWGGGDPTEPLMPDPRSKCLVDHESGSLSAGPEVEISWSDCGLAAPGGTNHGKLTFKEPPCQRIGEGSTPDQRDSYYGLSAEMRAALDKLYNELAGRNGCYRFNSGLPHAGGAEKTLRPLAPDRRHCVRFPSSVSPGRYQQESPRSRV